MAPPPGSGPKVALRPSQPFTDGLKDHPVRRRTALRAANRKELMKIQPLHDRVLATRIDEAEKTAGGLFIPDTAKEKPMEAIVVAVGSGKILDNGETRALDVKAGDQVLIGKYSGSEVKLDGKDHIILREDDILAIIDR
jgi:chaperonin GroES